MFRKLLAVTTLIMLVSPNAFSADYEWNYYMSPGAVTSIASDDISVWCGTEFGLVRWDRADKSYRIYRNPDGLPHSYINDLVFAPDGGLWVATEKGGIASFDGSGWTVHNRDSGLQANHAQTLAAGSDGTVYAGVYTPGYIHDNGEGLSIFDGDSWQSSHDSSFPAPPLRNIEIASDGTVWGQTYFLIAAFSDSVWTEYPRPGESEFIRGLAVDNDNAPWIRTDSGLYRLVGDTFETISSPETIAMENVLELIKSESLGIILATKDGGLYRYIDGSFETLADGNGGEWLTAVSAGQDSEIFGGTAEGSLAVFENGGWQLYTLDESLTLNEAHCVAVDRNNTVWSTDSEGICRYDGSECVRVWKEDDIPITMGGEYNRTKFIFDTDNTMWLSNNRRELITQSGGNWSLPDAFSGGGIGIGIPGFEGGIYYSDHNDAAHHLKHYCDGTVSNIPLPDGIMIGNEFAGIMNSGPDGALWCAVPRSKLFRYKNDEWTHFTSATISCEYSTMSGIQYSADGTVWIAISDNHGSDEHKVFSSRLMKLEPGDEDLTEVYSYDKGITLHCIDSNGKLWFSVWDYEEYWQVYFGIASYDGEFKTFTDLDGLPSLEVRNIAAAPDGSLWIACNNGVCRMANQSTVVESNETTAPAPYIIVKAYPNPFNPSTTIQYSVSARQHTTVEIFSISGQHIRTLVDETLNPGNHTKIWDGKDDNGHPVSSGLYLARTVSGQSCSACKISLIR